MPRKLIYSILFSSLPLLASALPLYPLKSQSQQKISIQVWVPGPPQNVFVSVNGIGYPIRSSPMLGPDDTEPSDPVEPVPTPQPSPPIPSTPAYPSGSIEYYAQQYTRSVPDAYDQVARQIESKLTTDHNLALQAMAKARDPAQRAFADAMTASISPLCEGSIIPDANSKKVADIWKSCARAMRESFRK